MRIRPRNDFKLLGTGIHVSKDKIYNAFHATNQPNWESRGLVFIINAEGDTTELGFLLDSTDYEVVE